jgi:CheY-like chemotaxis protein
MKNSLLIHNDNVPFKSQFTKTITFKPTSVNIDYYITHDIIPQIKKLNCQVIYVKDNLSSNYLELYGLRLIYHIRLSTVLGDRRLLPIVLLSDLDSFLLNKLSSMGRILFTKNIFITTNSIESVKKFNSLHMQPFKEELYQDEFLNLIEVKPPRDYLSHHDISNEWAIYRWAEFLKVESEAIRKNREKIASMLFFKYLLAKNPIEIKKKNGIQFVPRPPENSGKVLYIDDEWNKGWSDILKQYFSKNQNIEFKTFEYDFKNNNKFKIISSIKTRCVENTPDVVLLDLRLTQSDHETQKVESLTGIKITKMIKEINPAIQIIMLTATGKSTTLENLYEHGVLGYIKKEHPHDVNISTKENFENLKELLDRGLEKSYLKEIWEIQNQILLINLFKNNDFIQMRFEINSIFEILDSDMNKRYIYAMLSIHQCLEEINNQFIDDRKSVWIDTQRDIDGKTSTKNKILEILKKRLKIYDLDENIQNITHARNSIIHPNGKEVTINSEQVLEWFRMIKTILEKIEK